MAEPSAALVRGAQQGDEQCLVELISGQQSYVYSIALGVLGNPADAADVTQDAFLRLLRSLSTYRGETKFTTWLYRLVYNLAIDHLRRSGRTVASLDQEPGEVYDEVEDTDPWVDPLVRLDQQETANLVRQALAELAPTQRAALTLYYFDDMRYEEIAEVLGLPLNTLKSHLRRAKQRMAQLLGDREAAWTVSV